MPPLLVTPASQLQQTTMMVATITMDVTEIIMTAAGTIMKEIGTMMEIGTMIVAVTTTERGMRLP